MIKRYEPMAETVQLLDGTQEPSAEMRELKYGDWVSHEDYLSLESRHRALVEALERIENFSEYEMTEGLAIVMNIAHAALQEDNK